MNGLAGFSVLLTAAALAASAGPASDAPEPNRIVYWGNTISGKSVRVFNTAAAEKKAEAQVKAIGGAGWMLLENSTKTGYGAAICKREGPGLINFYTAHGYPSGREAVTAAKANGGGSFCSNALWRVAEAPEPRKTSVIEDVQGLVRKSVTSPPKRCEWQPAQFDGSSGAASAKSDEAPGSSCPTRDQQLKNARSRYVCMCVRG